MIRAKRGWHNPAKLNDPSTEGKCPYCRKYVKSLEAHFRSKHKNEKLVVEI
ncbi:hypothetical protein HYU09_00375 [Candidatus Woesearchaeota archaeon]|nr:hypothetical protein [Candidatus Woesearchaeota archaeon]